MPKATASVLPAIVIDEPGLFSQSETRELAAKWYQFAKNDSVQFAVFVDHGIDDIDYKKEAELFFNSIKIKEGRSLVLFYLAHESRELYLENSSDLDSLFTEEYKTNIKEDVLIPNFSRGWWAYGFEEASKNIMREIVSDGNDRFHVASTLLLWISFAGFIIALLLLAKRKNTVTITAHKITRNNILRSRTEIKIEEDERIYFDGEGGSLKF